MSAGTLAPETLSLLLKLYPAPRRLAESRSILRELQARFGRINTFTEPRHFNLSHNYIFAIFANRSAYDKALASGSFEFTADIPAAASILKQPAFSASSSSDVYNAVPMEKKRFRCHPMPSKLNHQSHVQGNPFHGPYRLQRDNITYQTLRSENAPIVAADFQLKNRTPIYASDKARLMAEGSLGKDGLMDLWRRANSGHLPKDSLQSEKGQDYYSVRLDQDSKEASAAPRSAPPTAQSKYQDAKAAHGSIGLEHGPAHAQEPADKHTKRPRRARAKQNRQSNGAVPLQDIDNSSSGISMSRPDEVMADYFESMGDNASQSKDWSVYSAEAEKS